MGLLLVIDLVTKRNGELHEELIMYMQSSGRRSQRDARPRLGGNEGDARSGR